MVTMNLGSVATRVYDRLENVPTNISGALIDIADEQRLYVEEWTGATIGSNSITERYQPVIIDFTTAKAMDFMQLVGTDASSMSLGDFKIDKGSASSLTAAADALRKSAHERLKSLGKTMRFRRVLS
jgi:hypothetical protein